MSILTLLADSFVRSTPVLVIAIAIGSLRAIAPARRHLALAIALAGFLIVPVTRALAPRLYVDLPAVAMDLTPGAWLEAGIATAAATPVSALLVRAAIVIWAAGALGLLARLLHGLILVHRLARHAQPVPFRLDIACAPRVLSSDRVAVPIALGLLSPVVVLPDSVRDWPAAERRAAIAHEVAHVRRSDGLTLITALVVRALFWPHPLVWIAVRRMIQASEEACDQVVVRAGNDAVAYAGMLVRLASAGVNPALTPLVRRSGLSVRVETLLNRTPARPQPARSAILAASMVAILAIAATASSARVGLYARAYGVDDDFASRIMAAARAERLHPALGFGLVSVESGFDRDRTSAAGAVGLTQLLPATAATLAPGITADQLRDPAVNLRLGFRLLRQLLDGFPDRPDQAVLSYHHGAAAVRNTGMNTSPYLTRFQQAASLPRY